MSKHLSRRITAALLIAGVTVLLNTAGADNIPNRVYELRTYTATEGNLDNLHARFRDHTSLIFLKHGMQIVGYWSPTDGPESNNTLVYMLSHANREAAAKAWDAFLADPQWKKVSAESNSNGPILAKVESKFLSATDYSPMK